MVQAGGDGVMVWGIFSWHTLGPLVPSKHRLNATASLSIVADHVHPFMTTVYPSSYGYFQQNNAPFHKAQIILEWFLEHDNDFTLLQRCLSVVTLDALTPASVHSLWNYPKGLNRLCLTVFSSLRLSLLLVHLFLPNFFLSVNFAFNMLWYSPL